MSERNYDKDSLRELNTKLTNDKYCNKRLKRFFFKKEGILVRQVLFREVQPNENHLSLNFYQLFIMQNQ